MKKQLIYDLPTRLFHWAFAGLFVFAFFIAKTVDDDSVVFSYHMLAGIILSFVVMVRLIWAVFGTKYAKFTSYALNPKELIGYFKGILSGDKKLWAGHNPASSWSALAMMIFALGLGLTGYLMTTGQKENFEELHEVLANGFLLVVLLHIAGIALHALRHKDGIFLTMLSGQKNNLQPNSGIKSAKPIMGLAFVGAIAGFSLLVVNSYNTQTRELRLLGNTLQLGEGEESGGEHKNSNGAAGNSDHESEGEHDED